jgi:hypothetical protein
VINHQQADAAFQAMQDADRKYHETLCAIADGRVKVRADTTDDPLPALLEEANQKRELYQTAVVAMVGGMTLAQHKGEDTL